MTLTREQVQAYLELASKATPEPWLIAQGGEDTQDSIFVFDEPAVSDFYNTTTDICEGLIRDDSEFIAESRTIAPQLAEALLQAWDEVERLQKALKELSVMSEGNVEPGYTESDELIAEGFAQGVKWMAQIARQALEVRE